MEDRTQELLKKCKEAGYESMAIFCADDRVPESTEYEKVAKTPIGSERRKSPLNWFGNWANRGRDENDNIIFELEPHLVCCHPPQRDKPGEGAGGGDVGEWPKIWRIGNEMSIFNDGGCGDSIKIRYGLQRSLTAGFYDLEEVS